MQLSTKKVLVINPNTTEAMLQGFLAQARRNLPQEIELVGISAPRGVAVVSTRATFVIAAQSVLETWASYSSAVRGGEGPDAVVIACFGDPGVAALRELLPIPVFGLAEESLRSTAKAYQRFAVVTAGPAWKSMLDELISHLDLTSSYAGTYAIDANGLVAAREPERFRALMQSAIEAAEHNGAKAIVLGGAALAGSAHLYHSKVPLVDCVDSAFASITEAGRYANLKPPACSCATSVDSSGLPPELAALLRQRSDSLSDRSTGPSTEPWSAGGR